MSELKTIGITGGIGSGKSYISALLQREFEIPVYDCDSEAKRLTAESEDIRTQLVELVGPEVFAEGKLNKQLLAEYLFSDPEHASKVNAIIHPAVLKDFKSWAEKQQKPLVALESAILFESGFNAFVDKVIFVDAPEEVRLQRAIERDSAKAEQIRARMKMQQPDIQRSQADFIIQNFKADDTKLLVQLKHIIHKISCLKQS